MEGEEKVIVVIYAAAITFVFVRVFIEPDTADVKVLFAFVFLMLSEIYMKLEEIERNQKSSWYTPRQ